VKGSGKGGREGLSLGGKRREEEGGAEKRMLSTPSDGKNKKKERKRLGPGKKTNPWCSRVE